MKLIMVKVKVKIEKLKVNSLASVSGNGLFLNSRLRIQISNERLQRCHCENCKKSETENGKSESEN